jgi:5'-nucleotidase
MDATPLILVSNDDGVHSAGIAALADALRDLGEVIVVAPDRERSAVSHSLTLHRPLRVEELGPGRYAIDGTPTDCVNLGVNGILRRRPAVWVLERGLPPDTLLNVNVPAPLDGQPVRGFALTRMGRRRYGDAIIEKVDPRGKKYYWIGGDELEFEDAEGTDFHAVSQGLISVTPIHLDLTNYKSFDALRALAFPWP